MNRFMTAVPIMSALFLTVPPEGVSQGGSPPAPAAERYFYVSRDNVNLHKSPGMRTGVIARVDSGEICLYEYEIGEWMLVKFPDNRQGFVHQSMIAPYTVGTGGPLPGRGFIADAPLLETPGAGQDPPEGPRGPWKAAAVLSLALNLFLAGLLLRKRLAEKQSAQSYDRLRELAKIEESKETLKRELFLANRQNQRLKDQISRLRAGPGG